MCNYITVRSLKVNSCFTPQACLYLSNLTFHPFHSSIRHEPFPNLLDRKRWYRTRLLIPLSSRKKSTGKIAYSTLYEQMAKCFKAVGIRGSAVTHLPRSAGAKSLEQKGVSEDQIRRLGEPYHRQQIPHGIYHRN